MSLLALALQQAQQKTWLNYSANSLAAADDLESVKEAEKIEKLVDSVKKHGKPVTKAWLIRNSGFSDRKTVHLIEELVRTRRLIPIVSERNRTSWAAKKK